MSSGGSVLEFSTRHSCFQCEQPTGGLLDQLISTLTTFTTQEPNINDSFRWNLSRNPWILLVDCWNITFLPQQLWNPRNKTSTVVLIHLPTHSHCFRLNLSRILGICRFSSAFQRCCSLFWKKYYLDLLLKYCCLRCVVEEIVPCYVAGS